MLTLTRNRELSVQRIYTDISSPFKFFYLRMPRDSLSQLNSCVNSTWTFACYSKIVAWFSVALVYALIDLINFSLKERSFSSE